MNEQFSAEFSLEGKVLTTLMKVVVCTLLKKSLLDPVILTISDFVSKMKDC